MKRGFKIYIGLSPSLSNSFKFPDPIAVMHHLDQKILETTKHYLIGITIECEEEYICKTATILKETTELKELGFQYVTEMDGVKSSKNASSK
jgi:hypothetical protein